MKILSITLAAAVLSTYAFSDSFAKGDASGKKLLSACKGAIKEYCGDVANKKDAKTVFECLDKHEDSLKAAHKKCFAAHEAFEKDHDTNEAGEAEHHE